MVQQNKRSKKRSPIRVNRKQDRSLKKEKKKKHNGGRTLKKNRNKDKKKFKDFIQKGGAEGEVYTHFQKAIDDFMNGSEPDNTKDTFERIRDGKINQQATNNIWKPFTYGDSVGKYITFYHKSLPHQVINVNGINVRNDLYEMTNFYEFIGGESLFYDGFEWKTSEHYFQACKVLIGEGLFNPKDPYRYSDNTGNDQNYKNVKDQTGPMNAFKTARNYVRVNKKDSELSNVNWHGSSPFNALGIYGKDSSFDSLPGDITSDNTNNLKIAQPATVKYQICLCIVYQKFRQNDNLRKILMNLTSDPELIIVEDSRDNDDSWGNGYQAKDFNDHPIWTRFKGNTEENYYWTRNERLDGQKVIFAPFNRRGHRNNILGLILTSVGRLFNIINSKIESDFGKATDEQIHEFAEEWIKICKELKIAELFSIFPWEHWLYGLHRNHVPLLSHHIESGYDRQRYNYYPNGADDGYFNIVVENFKIGNNIGHKSDNFKAHRYDMNKGVNAGPFLFFIPSLGTLPTINFVKSDGEKPTKDVLGLFKFLRKKKLGNYVYLFIKGGIVNATQLETKIKTNNGEGVDVYIKRMYSGLVFLQDFKLINTLIYDNLTKDKIGDNRFTEHQGEYVALGPEGGIPLKKEGEPHEEDLNKQINDFLNGNDEGKRISFKRHIGGEDKNFHIRLGDQAHSSRMPINNSDTGIIQVNIKDDNSRIVLLKNLYDRLNMEGDTEAIGEYKDTEGHVVLSSGIKAVSPGELLTDPSGVKVFKSQPSQMKYF